MDEKTYVQLVLAANEVKKDAVKAIDEVLESKLASWLYRLTDGYQDERERIIVEERLAAIRALMVNLDAEAEDAFNMLNIPEESREKLASLL